MFEPGFKASCAAHLEYQPPWRSTAAEATADLEDHKWLFHNPETLTHTDMMGFNIDYRDPSDEVFDPADLSPASVALDLLDPVEKAALDSAFNDFLDIACEVSPATAFRSGWLARAGYTSR
ncbi:hypothetical protein [Leifsonia xyli]|uniref:hypothetical protein n=1 Tax=Leifsonia xyli TaxID=1575 RepID=UPI003D67BFBC